MLASTFVYYCQHRLCISLLPFIWHFLLLHFHPYTQTHAHHGASTRCLVVLLFGLPSKNVLFKICRTVFLDENPLNCSSAMCSWLRPLAKRISPNSTCTYKSKKGSAKIVYLAEGNPCGRYNEVYSLAT